MKLHTLVLCAVLAWVDFTTGVRRSRQSTNNSCPKSCAAMGSKRMDIWKGCKFNDTRSKTSITLNGFVTWAAEIPGVGLALCDEERSMLTIQKHGVDELVDVSLAPLSEPVGAIVFEGKIYVACFGSADNRKPGLAVVDVATEKLEATYPFPDDDLSQKRFVHNVYAFDWDGQKEIFIAVLGNPWGDVSSGTGLVRFDRTSKTYEMMTNEPLNARAAFQYDPDTFYAITQEPFGAPELFGQKFGEPTRVVRLEREGAKLRVAGAVSMAARTGGYGGADVFMGPRPDTVFATDRISEGGLLYLYRWESDGFVLMKTWDIGKDPRYTTRYGKDIIVCAKGDNKLNIFPGLADDSKVSERMETFATAPLASYWLPFTDTV